MGTGIARIARRPLLGGLLAGLAGAAAAQPNELRLGALYPGSGALALLGDEHFRGLELAIEDRNAGGGLLGRPIKLLRGDAADAVLAQAEARRLIGTEHASALFGTAAAQPASFASQAAELLDAPYFELGAIADPLMERGFRFLFRTCPGSAEVARLCIDTIGEGLAPAWGRPAATLRVGLLHEDGMTGQAVAAAQDAQLRQRGITPTETLPYPLRGLEFLPLVQRLKDAAVEVLLHTGSQNDIPPLFRALREAGWRPRMVIGAGAGYSLSDTAHAIGPELEGTLVVDVPHYAVNETAAPGVQPFLDLYRKRYGSDPRSGHSLANYVGARAVLEAMQRAGALDRDKLKSALLALDVPEGGTANGWGFRFDERGQNQRARPALLQWQAGRLVTVAPVEAAVAPLRAAMGASG